MSEQALSIVGRIALCKSVHEILYRESRVRWPRGAGGANAAKASLALQYFLGFESGFTLDKESNTLALLCRDLIAVMAFETRERLIQWQVKLASQLGEPRQFLVLVATEQRLPAGPARLHLLGQRFALAAGTPPRLLGLWELGHLRRYGVVDGRFCFEGGALCGIHEGLHVLLADRPRDIADAFDLAARGQPTAFDRRSVSSRRSIEPGSVNGIFRADTRLSDFNIADRKVPTVDTASGLYEDNLYADDGGFLSPLWPFDEKRSIEEFGVVEARCIDAESTKTWSGSERVTLQRCAGCRAKLGTTHAFTSPVSTTPANFNPAWTMEIPSDTYLPENDLLQCLTPTLVRKKIENGCQCKEKPPKRPPKPNRVDTSTPLSTEICACNNFSKNLQNNTKIGPYENYDIPKTSYAEVKNADYYDTPKRIKESITDDLFRVTNATADSLVLEKKCGCMLKFGTKKKPLIVECDENFQSVECPCQKVTNWANNLMKIPYCRRNSLNDMTSYNTPSTKVEQSAIYATVDISRKINKQYHENLTENKLNQVLNQRLTPTNYENFCVESPKTTDNTFRNYENLEFAFSLEYYENAKDLLKKAGVTQSELNALSTNSSLDATTLRKKAKICIKCGHSQNSNIGKETHLKKNKSDEYLLMGPTNTGDEAGGLPAAAALHAGYAPMLPVSNWCQSLKHQSQKTSRVDLEKSVSNPILNVPKESNFDIGNKMQTVLNSSNDNLQKRSNSIDSGKILEDLNELDASIGSRATSSSLETLRNITVYVKTPPASREFDVNEYCPHQQSSFECPDSQNKVSNQIQTEDIKYTLHLRNKHIRNAQITRSSSVPCKSAGNRDSSSSNDSGVSTCSLKHGAQEFSEFEYPSNIGYARLYANRRQGMANIVGCVHASLPRKSRSFDPLRELVTRVQRAPMPAKSSSAEAEVPVLPPKQIKGVADTHSTSSGTSDMSDYMETLSLSSSHSSSDTPMIMRMGRPATSTLRPRSGKEYHERDPIANCARAPASRPP
ncbi:Protein Dok-7 [Eumeta japonica]|uniref:Protein Dok-7 n=1 Tax=Eumeta variegata TaxID=151549 RepID=A0A4C1ZQR5_EUMVA|nr:Protein Dok-7 [Eumeta japonica]